MGDLKQKTMKQMHGGEGEELLHKEDTEVVCRAAGIKKRPGGTEMLNTLEVFVDSRNKTPPLDVLNLSVLCTKCTRGVITIVKKMSLLLNWGRRSVPFWHHFSILDIEALTPDSPSALQVHAFTITRVTSESQKSIYLNNLINKSTSIDE